MQHISSLISKGSAYNTPLQYTRTFLKWVMMWPKGNPVFNSLANVSSFFNPGCLVTLIKNLFLGYGGGEGGGVCGDVVTLGGNPLNIS